MAQAYSNAVETARTYYNSDDADNFYFHVWGGEDIHVGLYEADDEAIAIASRRTVEKMADRLPPLNASSHVLDIGSGYGGAARYLAKRFGCQVTALNLAEKENQRNRQMTQEAGLADKITVIDGSFEDIPLDTSSVDVVWSQDAILHSGRRDQVVQEVGRVLKPGGQFLFTDILESGGASREDLEPVLQRIHLESLASQTFYDATCQTAGLNKIEFVEMTSQLVRHYTRVAEVLIDKRDDLQGKCSADYMDRMLKGLQSWVTAGEAGSIQWGILHYKKTA
ncbi:MAG: methyltransferase domain-containing protein [Pseudomonadota bacterium]